MKEYLSFVNGKIEYYQADHRKCAKDSLIPTGATLAVYLHPSNGFIFWKSNGVIWSASNNSWNDCGTEYFTFNELKGVVDCDNRCWQQHNETPTKDERVVWFEKFISGERVQYRAKDTKQWHNMTFNSLVHFNHKNLEFRNTPNIVEVGGFQFKTKEALLKYVDNNYQLD